jgi:hypothetical protein
MPLLESEEGVTFPQEVQEPALLDVEDDTPTRQSAAISLLSKQNVSSNENHQDSLALRQKKPIRKGRGFGEERAVLVSEGISIFNAHEHLSIIPVSEDPDLINVYENMPARFTQRFQEEVQQRDLTVPSALFVPADQGHTLPSDVASVQRMVQSSPLLPSGGPVSSVDHRWSDKLATLLPVSF